MIRRTIRFTMAICLGLVTALAISGTAAAYPANSGKFGTTFVDGEGVPRDDFGEHAAELGTSLCNGCSKSQGTDLVLMWQAILFAEGLLGPSDVDGYFGPRTADATHQWQRLHGVGSDGKVGDITWSAADDRLADCRSTICYRAKNGGITQFIRGNGTDPTGGAYTMVSATGPGGAVVNFASSESPPRIQFTKSTLRVR